jgi:enterochelin esterase-like enzyme
MGAPSRAGQRHRGGLTTDERQRLRDLERDNRELRRANEILRKASAYSNQIWIYTPPGYSRSAGPYPLVILLDGAAYVSTDLVPLLQRSTT